MKMQISLNDIQGKYANRYIKKYGGELLLKEFFLCLHHDDFSEQDFPSDLVCRWDGDLKKLPFTQPGHDDEWRQFMFECFPYAYSFQYPTDDDFGVSIPTLLRQQWYTKYVLGEDVECAVSQCRDMRMSEAVPVCDQHYFEGTFQDGVVTEKNGTKKWFNKHGQLHRDGNLPAIVCTNGTKKWCENGVLHRGYDSPAVEWANGQKEWFKNGNRCRDGDKPVVLDPICYKSCSDRCDDSEDFVMLGEEAAHLDREENPVSKEVKKCVGKCEHEKTVLSLLDVCRDKSKSKITRAACVVSVFELAMKCERMSTSSKFKKTAKDKCIEVYHNVLESIGVDVSKYYKWATDGETMPIPSKMCNASQQRFPKDKETDDSSSSESLSSESSEESSSSESSEESSEESSSSESSDESSSSESSDESSSSESSGTESSDEVDEHSSKPDENVFKPNLCKAKGCNYPSISKNRVWCRHHWTCFECCTTEKHISVHDDSILCDDCAQELELYKYAFKQYLKKRFGESIVKMFNWAVETLNHKIGNFPDNRHDVKFAYNGMTVYARTYEEALCLVASTVEINKDTDLYDGDLHWLHARGAVYFVSESGGLFYALSPRVEHRTLGDDMQIAVSILRWATDDEITN